jgi:hypothetical protein
MRTFIVTLLLLFTAACSYKITVTPTYSPAGEIGFSLSAPWIAALRPSPTVNEVLIYEVVSGQADKSKPLWRISSNGKSLSKLSYGVTPKGFEQKIPPESLEAGKSYEILIMGSGGIGALHSHSHLTSHPADPLKRAAEFQRYADQVCGYIELSVEKRLAHSILMHIKFMLVSFCACRSHHRLEFQFSIAPCLARFHLL